MSQTTNADDLFGSDPFFDDLVQPLDRVFEPQTVDQKKRNEQTLRLLMSTVPDVQPETSSSSSETEDESEIDDLLERLLAQGAAGERERDRLEASIPYYDTDRVSAPATLLNTVRDYFDAQEKERKLYEDLRRAALDYLDEKNSPPPQLSLGYY